MALDTSDDSLYAEQSIAQSSSLSPQSQSHSSGQVEAIGNMLADDLASLDTDAALEYAAMHTAASPSSSVANYGSIDQLTDSATIGNENADHIEALDDVSQPFAAPSASSDNHPDPKSYKQATDSANPFAEG